MTQNVLIVDAHPVPLGISRRVLAEAGYDVTVVSTFEDARRRLTSGVPLALLMTDVRLGPYNGLHLALRARALHPNICIIITDHTFDPALEREARGIGAAYVVKPISAAKLNALVADMFGQHSPSPTGSRRWARISLNEALPAAVGDVSARLLDMSYGGVRLQLPLGGIADDLPSTLEVVLPEKGVAVTIHPVWARTSDEVDGWLCGGELVDADSHAAEEWRRFVDSYAVVS